MAEFFKKTLMSENMIKDVDIRNKMNINNMLNNYPGENNDECLQIIN